MVAPQFDGASKAITGLFREQARMIPHQTLDDEIFANGLRHRVSACRKRLRINRIMHKRHDEVFSTTADFGFQENSAMRESMASIEFHLHSVEVIEPLVEEQKVSIT